MPSDDIEGAQLLNTTSTFRTTCYEKLWILALALVFIVGVSAATYLLIVEGRDAVPDSFTLIPRIEWAPWIRCKNTSELKAPVQQILLLPTNTTECWNEVECLKELRNLQEDHIKGLNYTDIPYNFLVAGDNRIYEGRGWNCFSSYDSNAVQLFAVAFLGKYDDRPPTVQQVKALEAFLENAIMDNRISNCYQTLSQDSSAPYITEVAFKLESRKEKNLC